MNGTVLESLSYDDLNNKVTKYSSDGTTYVFSFNENNDLLI